MELPFATILFCDIAQSTRFASVLGEKEYGELLLAYQSLGKQITEQFKKRYKGQCEFDIRGDQVCVIAYEDPEKDAVALVNLARDLKIAWLFSRYNREQRVGCNRSPVQLMMGIHTGKVTLEEFARSQSGEKVAEGYAISITKRVESSARHGRSWQIMITDAALRHVIGKMGLEYLRRDEVTLSEGLIYPVCEIIDIEPHFGKVINRDSSVEILGEHLRKVVQLDPTPWHSLLWSHWNLLFSPQPRDSCCHEQALLTNPYAIGLAQRLVLKYLHDGDPWQALILLQHAEDRAGDRRFNLEYHGVLNAVAYVMKAVQERNDVNYQTVKSYCTPALKSPEWRYAAAMILEILVTEGHAKQESVPDFPASKDPNVKTALEVIRKGLALVISEGSGGTKEEDLAIWKKEINDVKIQFSKSLFNAKMDVVSPLFAFYSNQHQTSKTRPISADVYDQLA